MSWLYQVIHPHGYRGALISVALGACAALALAPLYLWPLLFPSFCFLYWKQLHAGTARQAFLTGWFWGLGFFIAGLYWMVMPLWMFKAQFGWLIPFEILFIHGGLALFPAISGYVFFTLHRHCMWQNLGLFSLCYVAMEWLRGHMLTGFPWNHVGYVWAAYDESAQIASIANIYVLTWLTVCLAVTPVIWLKYKHLSLLVPFVALVAVVTLGGMRLDDLSEDNEQAEIETQAMIRLVQGNIPQEIKWDPAYLESSLRKYMALTTSDGLQGVDIVIWPETAFPFVLDHTQQNWLKLLGGMLREGQLLITGAVRAQGEGAEETLYNSVVVINHKGEMIAHYDKHHLVPFGEYVPLRGILPLEKITAGSGDFGRGERMKAIVLPALPSFLPLICYEVIFPEYAHDEASGWILNVTNDGWFGAGAQPMQHLDMARMRAIEQGKPMVRAASTGVSAVIDGYGRVLGSIGYGQEGVLDIAIPVPVAKAR